MKKPLILTVLLFTATVVGGGMMLTSTDLTPDSPSVGQADTNSAAAMRQNALKALR